MNEFIKVIGPNVKRPHGGAIPALSRKFEAEVHCWHPRSVCAQFRSDRTSGTGDKLKNRQLILQTLEANLSQSGWNMQDWTHAC